jgi:glycosyltransferase involved in cell wall biosynthesis
MSSGVFFSLCVPTYNRARLLPAFFAELSKQPHELFELVIVNDGSTDDTSAVIETLAAGAPFPVRHLDASRGGRARALNRALDAATGEFIVILGDDDHLTIGALARMRDTWLSIPAAEREAFCGVCGLSASPDGTILGDRFPADVVDSDFFAMRVVKAIRGDKREAVRRKAIGAYRFKVFDDEMRVPTSSLWLHLAKDFRTRFVNEVWCTMSYLPDGMTRSLNRIRMTSASSTAEHYRDVLNDFPQMPTRLRIRYIGNLVRYTLHSGQNIGNALRGLPMIESIAGSALGGLAVAADKAAAFRAALRANARK